MRARKGVLAATAATLLLASAANAAPTSIAVVPGGDVYVGDDAGKIVRLKSDGRYVRSYVPPAGESIDAITGISVDGGDVFAIDADGVSSARVVAYRKGGGFQVSARNSEPCPPIPHGAGSPAYSGIVATPDRIYLGGVCNYGAELTRSLQPAAHTVTPRGERLVRDGRTLAASYFAYLSESYEHPAADLDGGDPPTVSSSTSPVFDVAGGLLYSISARPASDAPEDFEWLAIRRGDGTLVGRIETDLSDATAIDVADGRLWFLRRGDSRVCWVPAQPGPATPTCYAPDETTPYGAKKKHKRRHHGPRKTARR